MKRKIQALVLVLALFFSPSCWAAAKSLAQYRNTEYGYSIMVLDTFRINPEIKFPMIFHGKDEFAMLNIIMANRADISVADDRLGEWLFEYGSKAAAAMDGEIVSQQRVTLNNRDAYFTLFVFKRNGKDYVFIMESVPDGKFIYNIAAITLPVDGYAELITQSINSFRW